MSRPAAPTLDRLAIIDDDGRRQKLQPADSDGWIARLKPWVRWILIGIFVALPWIDVGGHPAVLLDLPARRFHLFGLTLGQGDIFWLFFMAMAVGWALIVSTSLWGRVWCGWACPQTVYLEAIFRRIERLIEGTGAKRMALDLGPWTTTKLLKKLLKWTLWLLASFITAHIFLSYFFSIPAVVTMVLDAPAEHWGVFLVAAFATGITYFNFAWFREQTCLIVCPYGRLQSAMHDGDSITVGYDKKRGEPRGKPLSIVDGVPAGDCVDCRRCVQVCPTGIDIRNGLQMECIACGACIDACDDVMRKLHRPEGLVRYDSERGFAGEAKPAGLRGRIVAYVGVGVVGAVIAVAFAVTSSPLVVRVTRPAGEPFLVVVGDDGARRVQNTLLVHVENRATAPATVRLVVPVIDGIETITPIATVHLQAQERADLPVLVRAVIDAEGRTRDGVGVDGRAVPITLFNDVDGSDVVVEARLLGPRGP